MDESYIRSSRRRERLLMMAVDRKKILARLKNPLRMTGKWVITMLLGLAP